MLRIELILNVDELDEEIANVLNHMIEDVQCIEEWREIVENY